MSWDGYIDTLISHGNGNVQSACIIGLDGAKWTTDSHSNALKLTAQEAQNLAKVIKSRDMSDFQTNGIHIAGIKYQFLRDMDGNGGFVVGKKKEHGSVTLGCSKTAIVAAICKEGGSAGEVNKAVGIVRDYLESLNM